ncbi:MAG: acetyl/propionyl-CoA carboxylase subunit alpha, partial [Chloroflexota bacterium]
YDPMLAKVITWGADRAEAIRKMDRALQDLIVLGVTTNVEYLRAILAEPNFRAGNTSTAYLAEYMAGWRPATDTDEWEWVAAAVYEVVELTADRPAHSGDEQPVYDPWEAARGWRNVAIN